MHRETVRSRNLLKFITEQNRDICYDIIKKALITSKTTSMELDHNTMCFICPDWADKLMIKQSIENIFTTKNKPAKVKSVRIIKTKGKLRVARGRVYQSTGYKKAMVRLVEPMAQIMGDFNEK